MSEENLYDTTDFYTTATLILKGYEVKKITGEGTNGKVKRFFFEDSQELRSTIHLYMNAKLEGNIRHFRNAIDNVKDMVHSG